MREKRIQRIFVLAVLLAAGLCAACRDDKATATPPETTPTAQPSAPSVPGPAPGPREQGEDPLIASGPLVVEHQLDLVAQRDGIIVKVYADTGSRLKTGDPLLQLDDRQIRSELEATRAKTRSIEADLRSREAGEKLLQSDYERAKKMWDADLIPKEQLERAKSKTESEEWEIRRISELLANSKEAEHGLELELETTRTQAPFGGIVARRYIREGQSVARGDRLFWFTSEEPLRLRFTVPEKYLNRLVVGQRLSLTSPNFPQEQHTARVIEVSPVVDPASGTVEAMVELTGSPGSLRTGMTVTLRIGKLK